MPSVPFSLMSDGMEWLHVVHEMQCNGMPVSKPALLSLYSHVDRLAYQLQSQLSEEYNYGRPFNPKSIVDVRALMRRRGLVGLLRTDSGDVSTDKKSIGYLREIDPAMGLMFDCREVRQIRDSYCAVMLERIRDQEDRDGGVESPDGIYDITTSIDPTETETRRLTTENPNLLAQPVRTEIGRRVRSCFICRDGETFVAGDLSQAEMREMANQSRCKVLCGVFNQAPDPITGDKPDIHSMTASKIFKIPIEQVDKFKHRIPAKNAGFGIIYGISGRGLLIQLKMLGLEGWTEESCQRLINDWLALYHGVQEYINRVVFETRRTGTVTDRWGMTRLLPGIWSTDRSIASEAARQAVSHRIQGGAQGSIQRAMAWLHEARRKRLRSQLSSQVRTRLQVHDEGIYTMRREVAPEFAPLLLEALREHHDSERTGLRMIVPVEADVHEATNWGDLK